MGFIAVNLETIPEDNYANLNGTKCSYTMAHAVWTCGQRINCIFLLENIVIPVLRTMAT